LSTLDWTPKELSATSHTVQAAIMSEQKDDPLSVEEMQKIIEALKSAAANQKSAAARALKSALESAEAANGGKFFSPWTSVWTVEDVDKVKCKGAFEKMRRDENFMVYKGILNDVSKIETMPEKKARQISKKNRKSRSTLIGTGISSKQHEFSSVASSRSESVKTSASNRSQSMQYPDFSGRIPSTRAHMIPDPNTSDCHNYYNAICQAVVGCPVRDTKLLARRLATESKYNLLRMPYYHGNYFDHKPCWILVPACPLKNILEWKTEDTYPVLAVACGCGGTTEEEAYKMMCPFMYNDTSDDTTYLKRSKCKEEEFVQATNNLREMTLAMAETLVGKKRIYIHPT